MVGCIIGQSRRSTFLAVVKAPQNGELLWLCAKQAQLPFIESDAKYYRDDNVNASQARYTDNTVSDVEWQKSTLLYT